MAGTRRYRGWAAAVALMVAALLSACSGLPTTGPVSAGLSVDDVPDVPDFAFRPSGPQPGATPEQIVAGFVDAATNPSGGRWETAREFLDPEFRDSWQPEAGVTIDEPGDRDYDSEPVSADQDFAAVGLTFTVTATVDEAGTYFAADPAPTSLEYELRRQDDGEWRITDAPDGIVLDSDFFHDVFRAYPLMYWDPSWSFLVPDIRWFPYRQNVPTRIATALVEGSQSTWLADAVVNAFTEDVVLDNQVVTLSDGVAQVELSDGALRVDATTLGRMVRQLQASLRAAGVTDVALLVGGTELAAVAAPVQDTAIDPLPLVATGQGVGFLGADGVKALPGALGATISELDPLAFTLGRGEDAAAVQAADGRVLRVTDAARANVDVREGLLAPTIDPFGYVWSVPATDPTALRAAGVEGGRDVPGAWPEATAVRALSMSRDGTRLTAVVSMGRADWLVAVGVERAADRTPLSVGPVQRLALLGGNGKALSWLDDQSVGVLVVSEQGVRTLTQTVGGLGTMGTAPNADARTIAAGAVVTGPRVLDADGVLYTRRGSTWTRTASDVLVLGGQTGTG